MSLRLYRRWRPIRAVSFDLDDTLYDNVPVMRRAEQAVHAYLVEHFPQTAHWTITDWSARRSAIMDRDAELASDMSALRVATVAEGLREVGVANAEREAEAVLAEFLRHRNAVEIHPSTFAALDKLSRHLPLYALSNGNVSIPEIGLSRYFKKTWQPQAGRLGKPHLDMFHEAQAEQPELLPHEWLHVGDSPTADILGAQRAGWQSAWFSGGLYQHHDLQILPTLSYDHLSELVDWILVAYTVPDQ